MLKAAGRRRPVLLDRIPGIVIAPPTAPGDLSIVAIGNGTLTLACNASTGTGTIAYEVYEGTTPGGEGGVAVLTGQTNPASLIVSGLTNGTAYSFYALARNVGGASAHSNETTGTPSAISGMVTRRISQGFA